jgi:hypothetical protein
MTINFLAVKFMLFVAKTFIPPGGFLIEMVLEAGFWILNFKREFSLLYPVSSIQHLVPVC